MIKKESHIEKEKKSKKLPRNVWVVSITSFLTDVSSEMIINTLPLFLKNVLGVKTSVIGLIEGVAESTSSFVKLYSGWLSDKLKKRKLLAVLGYGISTLSKPLFYFANSWGMVAAARWGDRIGKGVRTAPRDALVADSTPASQRGFAFGFHRAADTAGAFFGLLIGLAIVWYLQKGGGELLAGTFRILVLASLLPAAAAVVILALAAKETKIGGDGRLPRFAFKPLGKRFRCFVVIVGIFELGNSSDAFIILRAQERGLSIAGIFAMLIAFNFVYTVISLPAGKLSDRIGRRRVIMAGWALYALTYLGLAQARSAVHIVILYVIYGAYYGLSYGTAKALVTDLVPTESRGMAFGTYNAVLGLSDLPASILAGILWSGLGKWAGFGPAAPFYFGAAMASLALLLFAFWKPGPAST
ncbi:MAG: MFS transporter [Acidobacteria bacterium]|nr:MFS transporter [Acidobacteriota bacterium]MBU4306350.1 MFS transporter [Acidobacteriota bacterium]MBU4405535.1 MFS transporter [Acidobacteriota bacterium]MCG2810755.1 MFS transporter [Candidatus Aminicenantes bacterium]